MNQLVLFEDDGFVNLLPLTFWRTVFELRAGRKILLDAVAEQLGRPVTGVWTREWIARVAEQRCSCPVNRPVSKNAVLVNGRWLLNSARKFPKAPCVGVAGDTIAFIVCDDRLAEELTARDLLEPQRRELALSDVPRMQVEGSFVRYPWDLVAGVADYLRGEWLPSDALIESEVDRKLLQDTKDRLHVGERTQIHPTVILDSTHGPLYLSHDVSVGPYAVLEGPLYVGPGSSISASARIHGGNAFGPLCKIGGEVYGCVIQGFSNKQHDGFLGHSYVGSWVNLGAGTVNSNLKNTYGSVRAPLNGTDVETGLTFFGAVIADHVKVGINSGIPTGAVLGFAAAVAGSRLIPKYVPSFAWVTDQGVSVGKPDRLLDVAARVMSRRNSDLTDEEVELFLDLGARVHEFESPPRRTAPVLEEE